MKKTTAFRIFSEILWIVLSAGITLVICWPMLQTIQNEFLYPVMLYVFLALNYFRGILFIKRSIYLQNIVMRILFFIVNIPLFFAIVIQLQDFLYLFDHFDVSQFLRDYQNIDSESALKAYNSFRSILIASAVSTLLLIFVMQIRLIQFILKYFR